MIVGSSTIKGFQHSVKNKFFESWGHIHITPFLSDPNHFAQEEKVKRSDALMEKLLQIEDVQSIAPYSVQSAVVKSKDEINGLVLKGYSAQEDFKQFENFLKEGRLLSFEDSNYSKEILLSRTSAAELKVKKGDKLLLYFIDNNSQAPKVRKVNISGTYATGLQEYDKNFALCDQRLIDNIQQNGYPMIQGYEIFLKSTENADRIKKNIHVNYLEAPLYAFTIQERFENIFTWLDYMKTNERILFIIMLIVAIMNMITGLLILILERTRMVGTLKAMGMGHSKIIGIFLLAGLYILGVGLVIGNGVGLLLCWLQKQFGLIKMNPEIYYLEKAPIRIEWANILQINALTILSMLIVLIIPALIVLWIKPVKALKFN